MSIYHCSIKIISRSGGRSAVASAAYRAGEKLQNDETGTTHDFTKKHGVVMNEVMLPKNAPKRYQDRQILWNEVQQIEKRSDAQFAREIEVALPVEMSRSEQIECVRNYVRENFVKEGMIADWALHDKEDGNPHAHILLTMRGLDEHERWLKKQKTVFANSKDEQGRPVYDPKLPSYDPKDKEHTSQYKIPVLDDNGNQKTRVRKGKGTELLWEKVTIPENDWNSRTKAESWRRGWALCCNQYLNADQQIDHRSYKRQGMDIEPTIHEGVTARQMEAEGRTADRCQINREIMERNSIRKQLKQAMEELTGLIQEKARKIYERYLGVRGNIKNPKLSGRNDGAAFATAIGTGKPDNTESEFNRRTGRIAELKRNSGQTEQEIGAAEQNIAATDRKIRKLEELIARKEAENNGKIRRLRERRAAFNSNRRPAERDRGDIFRESEDEKRKRATAGTIEQVPGRDYEGGFRR